MTDISNEVSELEAATEFVYLIIELANRAWVDIDKKMKEMFKDKFVIGDEIIASYDLTLAVIALQSEAVNNLFPKDQAERLHKHILTCVDIKDYGEYAKSEISEYKKVFENIDKYGNYPHDNIAARLLKRWLGKNIKNFEVRISEKDTGIIDPILVELLSNILITGFPSYWKTIKEKFKLKP